MPKLLKAPQLRLSLPDTGGALTIGVHLPPRPSSPGIDRVLKTPLVFLLDIIQLALALNDVPEGDYATPICRRLHRAGDPELRISRRPLCRKLNALCDNPRDPLAVSMHYRLLPRELGDHVPQRARSVEHLLPPLLQPGARGEEEEHAGTGHPIQPCPAHPARRVNRINE
ncbi:hypothetical protein CALVIDRAFT_127090 [Calocera viscosa TUFC12733]|uniref:Uncharacterized protein n=1 Tax=Calocera viscosa (strain TUFC12733) TaxID=1330018 RepID=A0A167RRR2_CALVF|nr:hypothetical protein CALVIDRAFT_127090 [Calocera viscosa TUFC12733]